MIDASKIKTEMFRFIGKYFFEPVNFSEYEFLGNGRRISLDGSLYMTEDFVAGTAIVYKWEEEGVHLTKYSYSNEDGIKVEKLW